MPEAPKERKPMIEHLPQDWRDATLLGCLLTKAGTTPVLVSGAAAVEFYTLVKIAYSWA